MKDKLQSAVDALQLQLEEQLREVAETKRVINSLRRRMGEEPLYADVDGDSASSLIVRPDQYYGKPLATAVQQYLERRKQACAADDIMKGLVQGGFDFSALGWKEKDRLRSLAMSLAKNTKSFHKLPNNTFGLLSWYDKEMLKRAERPQEKADTEEQDSGDATSESA